MWEYQKFIIEYASTATLNEELNVIGSNGWEIISIAEHKPISFGMQSKCEIFAKRKKDSNKELLNG